MRLNSVEFEALRVWAQQFWTEWAANRLPVPCQPAGLEQVTDCFLQTIDLTHVPIIGAEDFLPVLKTLTPAPLVIDVPMSGVDACVPFVVPPGCRFPDVPNRIAWLHESSDALGDHLRRWQDGSLED